VGVEQAEPAADGRGERHHRRAARVLEPQRGDEVLVLVGEYLEPVLRERPGRREQALHVGKQRLLVADDLELNEFVEPPPPARERPEPTAASRRLQPAGVAERKALVGTGGG